MKFQEILMNSLGILVMLLAAILLALTASLAISVISRSGKREAELTAIKVTTSEGVLMRCVPVEEKHATKD